METDAYFDHDDEAGIPDRDELLEGVERELYGKVLSRAADEDLKVDPDEARNVEEHADDTTPYT